MGFRPLEEIEGPIELTIRGRTYTLPVISMEQGIHLHQRIADGITDGELAAEILGPLLEQLAEDGASAEAIARVAAVALADWKFGRESAQRAWEDPKALVEMIRELTRLATQPPEPTASTTTTPASPSSTKKTTPKGSRSRGKKSLPTGTSS